MSKQKVLDTIHVNDQCRIELCKLSAMHRISAVHKLHYGLRVVYTPRDKISHESIRYAINRSKYLHLIRGILEDQYGAQCDLVGAAGNYQEFRKNRWRCVHAPTTAGMVDIVISDKELFDVLAIGLKMAL